MNFDMSGLKNDRMTDDIGRVIPFVKENLFPDKLDTRGVEIRFELCDESGIDGYCLYEDESDYIIELAPHLRGEDLIRAVIHEMVHVRQYMDGKLESLHIDGKGPRMYWQRVDMTDVLYEERPWECEASRLEDRLTQQFLSQK